MGNQRVCASFDMAALVKILTNCLTNDMYKKATVSVSMASAAGTIFIYLLAPLLITV
jgi:hypothetical protein